MTRKLGEVLRSIRETRNLTIRKFAARLGVSRSYISELERGKHTSPRTRTLERIHEGVKQFDLSEQEWRSLEQAISLSFMKTPEDSIVSATMSADIDLQCQKHASDVWILADRPFELVNAEYREAVLANLRAGVRYVYWSSEAQRVAEFVRTLEQQHNDGYRFPVHCIQTPSEATWTRATFTWRASTAVLDAGYLVMETRQDFSTVPDVLIALSPYAQSRILGILMDVYIELVAYYRSPRPGYKYVYGDRSY